MLSLPLFVSSLVRVRTEGKILILVVNVEHEYCTKIQYIKPFLNIFVHVVEYLHLHSLTSEDFLFVESFTNLNTMICEVYSTFC